MGMGVGVDMYMGVGVDMGVGLGVDMDMDMCVGMGTRQIKQADQAGRHENCDSVKSAGAPSMIELRPCASAETVHATNAREHQNCASSRMPN